MNEEERNYFKNTLIVLRYRLKSLESEINIIINNIDRVIKEELEADEV